MKKRDDNKTVLARREFLKTATGALVVGLGASQVSIAQVQTGERPVWERGVRSGPPDPVSSRARTCTFGRGSCRNS